MPAGEPTFSQQATGIGTQYSQDVIWDANGNAYWLHRAFSNDSVIYKWTKTTGAIGVVVLGNATYNVGNGWINDFCVSPSGVVYFISQTMKVFSVDGGVVTAVAGSGTQGYLDSSSGATARVDSQGIRSMVYANGAVFMFQYGGSANDKLRKIDVSAAGNPVSTVAGSGASVVTDGTGTAAAFYVAEWATADDYGNIWIRDGDSTAQYFRKITTGYVVTTEFTLNAASVNAASNLPVATTKTSTSLTGYTIAPDGNIFLGVHWRNTSFGTGYFLIMKLTPADVLSTLYAWQDISGKPGRPTGFRIASSGDLYLEIASLESQTGGTLGNTIQTITGVYVPPSGAGGNLSTLTDNFNNDNVDTVKWSTIAHAAIVRTAIELGDSVVSGYLRSVQNYVFDRAQIRINAAGNGSTPIRLESQNDTNYAEWVISNTNWKLLPRIYYNGSLSQPADIDLVEYDTITHKYARISRNMTSGVISWSVSQNGYEWEDIFTYGVTDLTAFNSVKAVAIGNLYSSFDNFNITVAAPTPESPPDINGPIYDPPDVSTIPDPKDLTAKAPQASGTTKTCTSLLDLVRQFSGAVKQPIRITGPSTIEMVNINSPLPTGWTTADAFDLYVKTNHDLVAGAPTLALESDKLTLNCSADFVTDDIRIVTSDWKIPEQLPVYGLTAGLVKKVSYAFSPTGFRASVDFHFRPVPVSVQRTSGF